MSFYVTWILRICWSGRLFTVIKYLLKRQKEANS